MSSICSNTVDTFTPHFTSRPHTEYAEGLGWNCNQFGIELFYLVIRIYHLDNGFMHSSYFPLKAFRASCTVVNAFSG